MQRYRAAHPQQGVLYLDAGRAFPLRTQESDVVIPYMMEGFTSLGLDVFNVGEADLDGGIGFLTALMREAGIPAVSANLVNIDDGRPVFPPFTIRTARLASGSPDEGAPRIAVVGFTDPGRYAILAGPDGSKVHFADPVTIAASVIPEARRQADAVIVLANFGVGMARQVAGAAPGIDLIIGNDERIENPMEDAAAGVPIVMTGVIGKRTIRIDFRKKPAGGWATSVAITELDAETVDDPEAIRFMDRFDRVLSGRTRQRADAQRGDPRSVKFLGAASCASCHPAEFEAWTASRHSHAWEPLKASKNTFNPLCMGCHSTGYLKPNGFYMEGAQPYLTGIGCEACHGAGGKHAEAPSQERMLPGNEDTCRGCHTPGQTPDFDFAEFWSRIRH